MQEIHKLFLLKNTGSFQVLTNMVAFTCFTSHDKVAKDLRYYEMY